MTYRENMVKEVFKVVGSSLDEPVGDVYYPILYPLFSNCSIQSGVVFIFLLF